MQSEEAARPITVGADELADIETLRRFKARYGQLVDAVVSGPSPQLLEPLLDLFTEDVVADFRPTLGLMNGRAALRQMFGTLLPASRAWVWHSFHSPEIRVAGERAQARWTLFALATSRQAPTVEPVMIYGRYRDEYVRTPAGWRQSRLEFVNETRSVVAAAGGGVR
jgi:hypothetical protein